MKKQRLSLLVLLSILCVALSSCSSEEIRQPEIEKKHRDTPYARALAKLKRANELTGQHRTRSGTDGVQGVIPLI